MSPAICAALFLQKEHNNKTTAIPSLRSAKSVYIDRQIIFAYNNNVYMIK